jgi:hypothetical protein
MLRIAKYLDLALLTAGAALLTWGLIRCGWTALLVGGGVALILLGVYGGRK